MTPENRKKSAADLAEGLRACTGAVAVTVTDGPVKVTVTSLQRLTRGKNEYGLAAIPAGHLLYPLTEEERTNTVRLKWSGPLTPPAVGAPVTVTMNGIGTGTVLGYFIEENWLGLHVRPDNPPDWFVRQNTEAKFYRGQALVFGSEVSYE
jgi:hypothetical protein